MQGGVNMNNNSNWKYCVIGNIVKTHIDEKGILRYGTLAFIGGRKVYLSGKYWNSDQKTITVIGLNRGRRYQVLDVDIHLIENVRLSKVYRPKILEIMNNFEFFDCWWDNKQTDKEDALAFIDRWNNKSGNII